MGGTQYDQRTSEAEGEKTASEYTCQDLIVLFKPVHRPRTFKIMRRIIGRHMEQEIDASLISGRPLYGREEGDAPIS